MKHINRFGSPFKPLMWFTALLLSAVVAGCGGGGGGGGGAPAAGPGGGAGPGPAGPAPALGAAAPFGGFGGGAGMTNQGINTVIAGAGGQPISLGTTADPGSMTGFHDLVNVYSETPLNIGFVNGTIITDVPAPGTIASKAIADAAAADAMAAFIDLRDRLGGIDVGIDPVTGNGPGELGGRTLAPGIYKSAPGSYAITNLDLTLDPQGNPDAVWVFQMPLSTLSVGIPGPAGTRSVNLLPPGQPKNVFWQVGSTATINPAGGGTMVGTIMAFAAINISTATAGNILPIVTLNGRALALGASTTMVNTVINVPAP